MKKDYRTMEEYIINFPEDIQRILEKMRKTIQLAAPAVTETILLQIPTFKLNGNLVHFAAFKSHIGFYPMPSGIDTLKQNDYHMLPAKEQSSFQWINQFPMI